MILKRLNVEKETTDKAEIALLKSEGFVPLGADSDEAIEDEAKSLEQMTVKELRELAETKGLQLSKALKKQDIIEILEEVDDNGTESSTD